mmetsp:Transcript_893/g.2215  ORF Transcript_893/g.2215 Transcript_893/m.2215 type:complete len:212 (+) Transcript_893:353-988(+)
MSTPTLSCAWQFPSASGAGKCVALTPAILKNPNGTLTGGGRCACNTDCYSCIQNDCGWCDNAPATPGRSLVNASGLCIRAKQLDPFAGPDYSALPPAALPSGAGAGPGEFPSSGLTATQEAVARTLDRWASNRNGAPAAWSDTCTSYYYRTCPCTRLTDCRSCLRTGPCGWCSTREGSGQYDGSCANATLVLRKCRADRRFLDQCDYLRTQ